MIRRGSHESRRYTGFCRRQEITMEESSRILDGADAGGICGLSMCLWRLLRWVNAIVELSWFLVKQISHILSLCIRAANLI